VTCDTFDDLAQVVNLTGDDNFIIGSDYGHADMSAEIDALRVLQKHAAEQHVSKETVNKILDGNARALYGLG
jgi:predicted TIM-barrel fold metal-dependent hydrolase